MIERGLSRLRRKGCDVDQAGHLRAGPRFGDDAAAIGMSDKDGGPILPVEDALRGSDVVGKRRQRVLDDADREALGGQFVVDAPPAGAVGEGTMDEDDVLDGLRLRRA